MESLYIRPGERRRLVNGLDIEVRAANDNGFEIDESIDKHDTAYHEACHALVALILGIAVIEVTNRPGPGYAGATWVAYFNAVVAAAAEAMGCDGTGSEDHPGSDIHQIKESGQSVSWAVSEARRLLEGRERELLAIATIIKKRRTISGGEVHEAKKKAEEEPIFEITVTDSKTGRVKKEMREANDNGPIYIETEKEAA